MHDSDLEDLGDCISIRSSADIVRAPAETSKVFVFGLDDKKADGLTRFSSLRSVVSDGNSRLTDAGLSSLATIASLHHLDVEWSDHITDAGVRSLGGLHLLEWLDLSKRHDFAYADLNESSMMLQALAADAAYI